MEIFILSHSPQLCAVSLKYKLLIQTTTDNITISISLYGNAVVSTRPSLNDSTSDAHFVNFNDRWSFVTQVIITRKFNRIISMAVLPTFIRRNFVSFMDRNNLFALGIGGRLKLNTRVAIIFDYFLPSRSRSAESYYKFQNVHFYNPLAIGFEIETGGHVFHINFSNSTAILENQFIPYTTRSWFKGEFRLGFNISRSFTLFPKKNGT